MEDKFDITVEMDKDATIQMLKDSYKREVKDHKNLKHMFYAVIISYTILIAVIVGGGLFAFYKYERQFETLSDTTTYTEEMTTEGDNAYINNVEGSQYNDNVTHTESDK